VPAALAALSTAGFALGLCTNKPGSATRGVLAALALEDGATLWTRDLAPEHERFQDADATPAVLGDMVVAASAAGGIYGLDVQTGAIRWHLNRPGAIGLTAVDSDVVVAFDRGVIARVSGFDGRIRWRTTLPTADGAPSEPMRVGLRYIAVTTGRGTLHLMDEMNGRPVRQFRPGNGIHGAPATAPDGSLFVLSDGGILYALRPPR
ncbi:MAG: PQQ-binding-like beta-propeller repeat protein, partial [Myxococcales bacterium]|nr:PQQ-binding-like beta-propeller repeat protein [Myxococcales bacterium]